MGNLQQAKKQYLFNVVDGDTLKLYDSNTKLLIAGFGEILDSAKLETILHGCYEAGVPQAEILDLLGPCPCTACNYEAGITVHRIPRMDGWTNQYWPTSRYYAQAIEGLGTCTSGFISSTDLKTVKDGIIENIMLDENFPHNQLPAAIVQSGEAVMIVHVNDANNITLHVTGPDGTAYAQAGVTTVNTTRAALIIALNAKLDTAGNRMLYAYADPLTATGVYLIPYLNGAKFTVTTSTFTGGAGRFLANDGANDIAITGTGTAVSDTKRFVGLVGVNADIKFRVTYPSGFATQTTVEEGSYAILTADDVARLFPIQSWMGGQQPNLPIKGMAYCKYKFKFKHDTYDVTAASHTEHYEQWVEIFVMQLSAESPDWNGVFNAWLFADGSNVVSPLYTT